MEANKARNMIIHKDEIASRPAKTFIQRKREKAGVNYPDTFPPFFCYLKEILFLMTH